MDNEIRGLSNNRPESKAFNVIQNASYKAMVGYLESREGQLIGNGHHVTQDLCELVSNEVYKKLLQKNLLK